MHFRLESKVVFYDPTEENAVVLEALRGLGSKVFQKAASEKMENLSIIGEMPYGFLYALLEGLLLASYQFLKYKTEKKPHQLSKLSIISSGISSKELEELTILTEATFLARDWVNTPVIDLDAEALAHEFVQAGNKAGFTAKILFKKDIEELKMGGLLGVNTGSVTPPTFTVMEHKPKDAVNDRPLVLVGKGVVYDTGGMSLKPGNFMVDMKCDMGGSAAVVGAMYAIAKAKLPYHVICLVPATDNRVDGNALVPDDVITMHDGTTVEVLNTDAEGRLILADALAYAKQFHPELVIDVATLTGFSAMITGEHGLAMMGNAADIYKNALKNSGEQVYERVVELPMWKEFEKMIDSNIADIKNISDGRTAGAMTAAKFLEHFTDYPWMHLDIAGAAFTKAASAYRPKGGTGYGVRLLYEFAKVMSGE